MELVLVARRGDRLEALARELTNVRVEALTANLADPAARQRVEQRLAADDEPVDLLVNTAGVGGSGAFVDLPVADEEDTVLVNALAPTRLCHAALTAMDRRGRGAILNVSSVAGLVPAFPGSATYAATKAYLCSLSESLRMECRARRSPVRVTVVCPGYVRTDMTRAVGLPSIAWVSRENVVRDALRGLDRNRPVVVPGLLYKATRALPRPLLRLGAALAPK